MNVIYTNKAKDDLARIDWRVRSKIITTLGAFTDPAIRKPITLKRLHGSDLVKTTLQKHVVVGEADGDSLNVLCVFRQQKLKASGVKIVQA